MVLMVCSWLCIIISKVMMVMMLVAMMMIVISKVFIKSDVHHQLLPWSDEQIRWAPLITLMVGCKKKCGGISIEIYATSLSKKISTPSLWRFAKEDIWLEARQSQSKLHSKHSDLKYLHVNLKYFWRAPKVQISLRIKSWFRAFPGQWYLFLLSNQSLLRKI